MNLDPIVAALKAAGVVNVTGLGGLAKIAEAPPNFLPALFVAPEGERGEAPARVANQNAGIFDQGVVVDFVVVMILGGSAADAAAVDREFKRLAGVVEGALAGWAHPDAEGRKTELRQSRLLPPVSAGTTAWAVGFRTYRRIRKIAS